MPDTHSHTASAERQLNWSRRYLRREKRGRFLRRSVLLFAVAASLALGVYAVTADGFSLPFLPAFAHTSGSGTDVSTPSSSFSVQTSDSASPPVSSGASDNTSCTVTFDARGGTMSETACSAAYGSYLSEPEPPVRAGYTFGGWYTDVARTRVWDFAKNTVLEDLTLYARWQQNAAENNVLPQTGIAESATFWLCVLGVCLALSCVLACLWYKLEQR